MNLLVITQKVDNTDPLLGFFCAWIDRLSEKYEKLTVLCLEKGTYEAPKNVRIFSLGKEYRKSRPAYIVQFYKYIFSLRHEYNAVFVHMNQEYVLMGGPLWKLWNKPVFMWRNHAKGNILTSLAVSLSTKVFYTSLFSYTARFKKSVQMPVGVDTDLFTFSERDIRTPQSILSLGRISPVKYIEVLIDALAEMKTNSFSCDLVGDPPPQGRDYYQMILEKVQVAGLESKINFHRAVPNHQASELYRTYDLYTNMTPSGSFDKTIIESMAAGALPVVCNESLREILPEDFIFTAGDPHSLATKLKTVLSLSDQQKNRYRKKFREYAVDRHSLHGLIQKLSEEIGL